MVSTSSSTASGTSPPNQSTPNSVDNVTSKKSKQSYYYPSFNAKKVNGTSQQEAKATQLSYILSLDESIEILGKDTVRSIVNCMKHYHQHNNGLSGSGNNQEPSFRCSTESVDHNDDSEELVPTLPVMGIDKVGAMRSLLPPSATPHAGSGGHLALMECVFYALAKPKVKSMILLQDLIIFFAIIKGNKLDQLAKLSFRVYDGFLKRSLVTRDTLHRFLADIYGEEYHKRPAVKKVLDIMFTDRNPTSDASKGDDAQPGPNAPLVHLNATSYVSAIQSTIDQSEDGKLHFLLDWLLALGKAMLPKPGFSIPLSNTMQKLLKRKLDILDVIFPDASIRTICQQYGLLLDDMNGSSQKDLYEMKRRYRSIVDQDIPSSANGNDDFYEDADEAQEEGHHLPMDESEGQPVVKSNNNSREQEYSPSKGDNIDGKSKMKNVITENAFIKAISHPSDEHGHGGYLPSSLARLIFLGGFELRKKLYFLHDSSKAKPHWTMYDTLSFGLCAVRGESLSNTKGDYLRGKDAEIPLLKFLFRAFLLLPHERQDDSTSKVESHSCYGEDDLLKEDNAEENFEEKKMTRYQVGHMLLLLVEHMNFRLEADSPPESTTLSNSIRDKKSVSSSSFPPTTDDDDNIVNPYVDSSGSNDDLFSNKITTDTTTVETSIASLLGLVPPDNYSSKNPGSSNLSKKRSVSLKSLVDYVFEHCTSHQDDSNKALFSFQDFINWYYTPKYHDGLGMSLLQCRIGPILQDLRLIASIVFGIQPSLPSMENSLVSEVERRHKYRYPQTDNSKRGPMGTVWYVIQSFWWKKWCAYAEVTTPNTHNKLKRIGVINNNALLMDDGSLALKPSLRWKTDFELVSPLAWSALQAWHDGGPPIHRSVVSYCPTDSNNTVSMTLHEIEMYPLFVTVLLSDSISRGEARPFQQYFPVSRFLPMEKSMVGLCDSLEVKSADGRLWFMGTCLSASLNPDGSLYEGEDPFLLHLDTNLIDQLKEKGIPDDVYISRSTSPRKIVICFELRDEKDGSWPMGQKHNRENVVQSNGLEKNENLMGDGVVGLYNMGNTCYLNSSIQCLSHTPIFRDYFTSKSYLNDINTTNPLGHQGHLAQVSAVLINSLWRKFNQTSLLMTTRKIHSPGICVPISAPSLTPKSFKEAIGKFNDHFAGNEQHDAQELLAFLLSGLSEDLNRIVDKPYIEAPDSDGRPDKELADIWWSNHLKREMSIIVALFTGQYKSLLTCRTCKYESARFEPFACLQLPLPEDDQISVQLIYFPLDDDSVPMKYSIRVKQDGSLFDILVNLAKVLRFDADEEKLFDSKDLQSDSISDGSEISIDSKSENQQEVEDSTSGTQIPLSKHESETDDQINSTEISLDSTTSTESNANIIKSTNDIDADEEERVKEKIYSDMAESMAVVKMGDGYIFNIIPDTWSLSKLQNRDTGEIPPIFVYELDPLPSENYGSNENNAIKSEHQDGKNNYRSNISKDEITVESEGKKEKRTKIESHAANPIDSSVSSSSKAQTGIKFSYLAFMQRKLDLVNNPLLHYYCPKVFGSPMLLRVVELEGYTGRDLYDLVAKRIRRFVPEQAFRFLSSDTDHGSLEGDICSTHNTSPSKRGGRQNRIQSFSDTESSFCGKLPRYGFRLRIVSRDGKKCSLSPWYESCIGCVIPDDDSPTIALCGDSIALDWHMLVDLATDGFGSPATEMDSVGSVQARMLDNIKRHRTCHVGKNIYGYRGCISLEECMESFAKEERIPEAYCSNCREFRVQTKKMSIWRLPPVMIIHLKRFQFTQHMRRKLRDLVVFPTEGLDFSNITASYKDPLTEDLNREKDTETTQFSQGENDDKKNDHEQFTSKCCGRKESLYDLYGVVHHQGALSGGHYVASLKSEIDGKWRLFNDAQIYEIGEKDVVDASAYILFYIRKDAKNSTLDKFWDTRIREGEGMTEEEVEKMMKQRSACTIS